MLAIGDCACAALRAGSDELMRRAEDRPALVVLVGAASMLAVSHWPQGSPGKEGNKPALTHERGPLLDGIPQTGMPDTGPDT